MSEININLAKDFSDTPGGRHKHEGPHSGELFRETILEPKYLEAVSKNTNLIVNLDGCYGYPPSFIEESFGGLVRSLKKKDILKTIKVVSQDEPGLILKVNEAIKLAEAELW